MTNGTKRRIVVSTLEEAEFFAKGGFDDMIYAMLFTEEKIPRFQSLMRHLESFHVVVENKETVRLLERHLPGDDKKWSVFLFTNSGNRNDGALWSAAGTVELAKMLHDSPHIAFQGLYTHESNSYEARGQRQIEALADVMAEHLDQLASSIREMGIECKEVGFGSTPTGSHPGEKVKKLTELHPGNYVFYDVMQKEIGSCDIDDIAVRVMTRVIGWYPERDLFTIDAGWTALSKQGPAENGSYVVFEDYPGIRLCDVYQEYGIVKLDTSQHSMDEFPVGKALFMYPYHSCATCAMHRQYFVHRRDDVVDVWRPCSGW